jgi:hypothetical protein
MHRLPLWLLQGWPRLQNESCQVSLGRGPQIYGEVLSTFERIEILQVCHLFK